MFDVVSAQVEPLERGEFRLVLAQLFRGLVHRRPVRRQQPRWAQGCQTRHRIERCPNPGAKSVVPFGIEPGVHSGAVEHPVAAEGKPLVALFKEIGHCARRVAARVHAAERMFAPDERVIRTEGAVERDGLDGQSNIDSTP